MSGSSSEEKSLPASGKKLAAERRKGNIPKAPDLQSGTVTIVLIGWLLLRGHALVEHIDRLIDVSGQTVGMDLASGSNILLTTMQEVFIKDALSPLILAVVTSVLIKLVTNGGFIFAIDPIIPKPERLDPIAGFKNLFKAQTFIDLALSVVKVVFFGGTLALLVYASIGVLVRVPEVGATGLPQVLFSLLAPMLGAACLFYAIAGMVDLLIQRHMFVQEMRMTQTEAKNERKETQGNPQIKSQQRRLQMQARTNVPPLGPKRASVMICDDTLLVGLRYSPPDTPIPRLVCRVQGAQAEVFREIARNNRIPITWDRNLAHDLAESFKPGMTITPAFFQRVARVLQNLP